MPFRFSLATVLNLRENLEQKEARILEQRYAELAAAQGHLWEAEQNITRAQQERAQQLNQGTSAFQLQLALQEEANLKHKRLHAHQKLQEAQTRLREQIDLYKQARQQRDTLEELRKRQAVQYQRQQAKAEQQERDELYLLRNRTPR
jgi:flagellar export protein FliJ